MKTTWLGAVLILGFTLPQICSLSHPCLSTVELCMSDLCMAKTTATFCEENVDECQMKEWAVCNLSLPSVLELYPTLKACVCEQEAALCASIPALLTQCHQKTAAQRHRSSDNDWQSSTLLDLVDDTSGSCLERIRRCLSDAVCNGRMAPVLQDCMEPNCDPDRCQTATTAFFRAMPPSVGRMLVMCQCQDSDEACGRMSSALHSGSCGTERTNCLHIVTQCIRDRGCRRRLSVFQWRCWISGDPQCLATPYTQECLSQMNPAVILGAEPECQTAFLDTVGTALHYPCSCEGLLGPDLQTCGRIHEVFHNRSLFIKQWKDNNAPTKPPSRSEDVLFDLSDLLLPGFACVLLTGVTILAISLILWLARRRKENKLHSFQKTHTVSL
ncbi:GDNF family receptor alpha-like [Periophthalmus magnuspinnatus]|uniref:GDNF family receptor alpha-like n=1 Tax=Periophthalmus magnuspinnatus TaxID=409849 RepID=UPI0024364337|nr:GDNF family receptor alpha-like [Periophthalmus magnuspinnatus]